MDNSCAPLGSRSIYEEGWTRALFSVLTLDPRSKLKMAGLGRGNPSYNGLQIRLYYSVSLPGT